MLHYFRWNDGTVILNLNQHFFRFVAINLNVDLSIRLITDCLNRIFQKINDPKIRKQSQWQSQLQ